MGDVCNQNHLSFQQPLERSPPGPLPWGLTFPPGSAGWAQLGGRKEQSAGSGYQWA